MRLKRTSTEAAICIDLTKKKLKTKDIDDSEDISVRINHSIKKIDLHVTAHHTLSASEKVIIFNVNYINQYTASFAWYPSGPSIALQVLQTLYCTLVFDEYAENDRERHCLLMESLINALVKRPKQN